MLLFRLNCAFCGNVLILQNGTYSDGLMAIRGQTDVLYTFLGFSLAGGGFDAEFMNVNNDNVWTKLLHNFVHNSDLSLGGTLSSNVTNQKLYLCYRQGIGLLPFVGTLKYSSYIFRRETHRRNGVVFFE